MLARLNSRRNQILSLIDHADHATFPTNPGLRALTGELAQIEAALVQSENTDALKKQAADFEAEKASHDDAAFWFRRFITSLGIGHGAAFLAVMAGVFQAEDPQWTAKFALVPAIFFALGLILAGALPYVVWLQREGTVRGQWTSTTAVRLTLTSAGLFVGGMVGGCVSLACLTFMR